MIARTYRYAVAFGVALFATASLMSPAWAETARTIAGKEVRLRVSIACSVHGVRHTPPEFNLLEKPTHGTITSRNEKPSRGEGIIVADSAAGR